MSYKAPIKKVIRFIFIYDTDYYSPVCSCNAIFNLLVQSVKCINDRLIVNDRAGGTSKHYQPLDPLFLRTNQTGDSGGEDGSGGYF
jgi:hypothetical protein